MRDQRSSVAADEERVDVAVIGLLLSSNRLWSLDEVSREIGALPETQDSLARLHGAGLVHRLENFVFATRAAVEATRLGSL